MTSCILSRWCHDVRPPLTAASAGCPLDHRARVTSLAVRDPYYCTCSCSIGRPRHYVINMDKIVDELVVHPSLSVRTYGNPIALPGRISNGILLDGSDEYIAVENQSDACISSISRCYQHGLMVSMWTKFRRLQNGMAFLSTGNGIKVRPDTCISICMLACIVFIRLAALNQLSGYFFSFMAV